MPSQSTFGNPHSIYSNHGLSGQCESSGRCGTLRTETPACPFPSPPIDITTMDNSPEVRGLACLGPLGTYTHQAAFETFGTSVSYHEKPTIKDTFEALSPSVPFAVIPQENSTFGSVIETYDLLRTPIAGRDVFIRGQVIIAVQHCLVARHGVRMENIKKILSHEQALGQCKGFLRKCFPDVSLVKTSSTAAAAEALLSDSQKDSLQCAAICSRLCATLFEGLETLQEGVQDLNDNFTRFFILEFGPFDGEPLLRLPCQRRALIRLCHPASPCNSAPHHHVSRDITTLLSTLSLSIIRVDRRPSLQAVPFHDVYFVEVHDSQSSGDLQVGDAMQWRKIVNDGIERMRSAEGEATLLGLW